MVSRGTLVSTLISSDVAKYVGFRLLDGVSVWDAASDSPRRVPGSKEDVFRDKSISLPEKRKLMKALLFAGSEFEEDEVFKGELSP
jgi:RAB protein geranylgeranyltransferase component A